MNLLGENFYSPTAKDEEILEQDSLPSSALLDLQWPTNSEFLGGNFMPSQFIMDGNLDLKNSDRRLSDNVLKDSKESKEVAKNVKIDKTNAQMSWLSLFAELDPLANQDNLTNVGDRA